jgi:hypothetical protein
MVLLSGALGVSLVRDISFTWVDHEWLLGMQFWLPILFSFPS